MFLSIFIGKSIEEFGPGAVIMPIMEIVIAVFQIGFACMAAPKGWLS